MSNGDHQVSKGRRIAVGVPDAEFIQTIEALTSVSSHCCTMVSGEITLGPWHEQHRHQGCAEKQSKQQPCPALPAGAPGGMGKEGSFVHFGEILVTPGQVKPKGTADFDAFCPAPLITRSQ